MGKAYKDIMLVGLTGQTGAGKTVAGQFFADKGFGVINCDLVSRKVVSDGSDCLDRIVEEFSDKILNPDGTLNRQKLAMIVFTNNQKLIKLNEIILPYICEKIFGVVDILIENGFKTIVLDAPTLFESGLDKKCDIIISVIAPEDDRVYRIVKRDNIKEDMAQARVTAQLDEKFYRAASDYVIDNNQSLKDYKIKLEEVYSFIKNFKV